MLCRPETAVPEGLLRSLVLDPCREAWVSGGFPPFPELTGGAPCAQASGANSVALAEHLLSSWEVGILVHGRQSVLM